MTDLMTAPVGSRGEGVCPPDAVSFTNVRYTWPGPSPFALSVASFALARGEKLLLLGPSGSGKSTFLSLLAGIVAPDRGRIDVLGTDMAELSGAARDRFRVEHFGIIFQMFNLLPYASLVDNVLLPLRFSRTRRDRTLADRKFPSVIIRPKTNLFSLDFHAEQVPNPDSRISLAGTTDRFDNRQVRIDWRYTRQDVDTVAQSFDLLRDELAEQSIGQLTLAADEADIDTVVRRDGAYGGHHIGTARMGATERSGVVDRDGKVFGVNNLYVAGSAVFATSSQANPTLTIVAMALRLASHLGTIAARVPAIRTTKQPAMVN